MRIIETQSNTVGKQHAQVIRKNVGIAADFIVGRAAIGLGATTGYVAGFLQGLFGTKTSEGATSVPNV